MQKAHKTKQQSAPSPRPLTPRVSMASGWVLRSVAGLVVVFAGFGVFQLVSAEYTLPTCDPLKNIGQCPATSGPLLLSAGSKQTLESDVDIGKTGATKTLNMYGAINLNTGSKLQTANANVAGAIAGTAIDIQSSNDYAIYGRSGGTAKAGLYGVAAATSAHGVMAVNALGGYALFVDGSASSGKAARFIGPMELSNGTNDATFSIVSGNLNIQTSVADKGVTVNGIAAGDSSLTAAYKIPNVVAGNTAEYSVRPSLFPVDKQYEVTSIQVLYDRKDTPDVWWQPLDKDKAKYTECTGAQFTGRLDILPFAFDVGLRIIVTYDPQAPFICPNQDSAAPTNVIVNLPSGGTTGYNCGTPTPCAANWQTSTINISASASDNIGVTSVEYFVTVSGVTTSLGSVLTTTSSTWTKTLNTSALPFANSCSGTFNFSGVCSVALTTYVITAKATDAAGNISLTSPGKSIYVTNGQLKEPCNGTNGSIVCGAFECGVFSGNPSCAL